MEAFEGWRSRGYLPHVDAGERPQFLTWRIDDSFPADLLQRWRDEIARAFTLEADRKRELYRRLEGYLDEGHGNCVLCNPVAAIIVQDALVFHHDGLYELHEWTIMPNHVHVLLSPLHGTRLAAILHSLKSFTSKEIHKRLGGEGRLWQPEYFDRFIRDEDHFAKVAHYIRWDPVKAKLCVDPKHWPYGSANYDAQRRL